MKKRIFIFLAVLILISVGVVAYVASPSATPTATKLGGTPSAVEYDQNIACEAQFVSSTFTCVETNGNSLRYWFDNTADSNCSVELYRKGILRDTKVSSMAVSPNDPGGKANVLKNPGNDTYYFVLYSADGGLIQGHLRANQFAQLKEGERSDILYTNPA